LQNATQPTNIVITAAILSNGTVAMAYTLTGPLYPEYSPRTGVRLNDGTIETFQEYGITQTTSRPQLAPAPTTEAPFVPPPPTPPAPALNAPTNVVASQIQDGSVQITWDSPTPTSTSVERYAVGFSTNNFNTGWAVSSNTNSIIIPRETFQTSGGLDATYQFRIRSDNDTLSTYSQYSTITSVLVASPPPPTPTVPDGAEVINEGSTFEVVAPVGQRIANAVGYYGDPNNSTRGGEVSSILFELLSGETSATIEVSNETFGNDPAPGTSKVLILLITYEDIPVQPTPEPTPTIPIVDPTPPVTVPESPVTPTPEETVEPEPEPETIPPTEESTPEPTPSEEPTEEPTEVEPEPLPESEQTEEPGPVEPIVTAEELPEEISSELLMQIDLEEIIATDLTEAQAEALIEAALEVFETAEQGSEEYVQALEALFVAAQQDDIVLDEALAAIPLLGDVLGGATELVNFLGNAGADMSPEVREDSEKVVVTAIVAVQAALSAISISGIATTVNLRNGA
jgi:hypothetical protein